MKRFLLLGALLLAGCGTPVPETPSGATPTPDAPYDVSALEITTETAPFVRQLGVLSNADTNATVFALSLSPDGTRLAGLNSEQLLAWDLLTGQRVFANARQEAAYVFYSADKTEIYTLTPTSFVRVFDENGREQNSFRAHDLFERALAFHPDLNLLTVGGQDGTVRVWDMYERTALVTLSAHTLRVSTLAFSPDGTRLATAGDEGLVSVWDWRARALLYSIDTDAVPYHLAFSPDGTQLAVSTVDSAALYIDGTLRHRFDVGQDGCTQVLLVSPNARYILCGGLQVNMTLWDLDTGTLAARLPDTSGDRATAEFSPDGGLLITSLLGIGARLWNLETVNAEDQTIQSALLPTSSTGIYQVDWSPDSRLIVLADAYGPVFLWGIGGEALAALTPTP